MKVIAYQTDGNICRFIYEKPSGNTDVVSCENYGGMKDFLNFSDGKKLNSDVDIWEYKKSLSAVKE